MSVDVLNKSPYQGVNIGVKTDRILKDIIWPSDFSVHEGGGSIFQMDINWVQSKGSRKVYFLIFKQASPLAI